MRPQLLSFLAVCLLLAGCKTAPVPKRAVGPPLPPGVTLLRQPDTESILGKSRVDLSQPAFVELPGLRFTSATVLEGHLSLSWQGGSAPYQLQSSLTPTGPWSDLGPATGELTASVPITAPEGYYRLLQAPVATPGACLWSTNFGGSLPNADSVAPSVVREDQSGNVYVTGAFLGTNRFGGASIVSAGAQDAFLAKWSAGGALQWAKRIGGPNHDFASSMAIDAAGNVIIGGAFGSVVDFGGVILTNSQPQSMFVAKYDGNGSLIWAKTYAGVYNCFGLACDGGNILMTGYYGTANFGGGPPLPPSSGFNAFVVKLNSAGAHVWSHGYGQTGANIGYSIATAANGDAVVVGAFQNTASFGGSSSFTSHGKSDIFLAKYSSSGVHLWSKAFGGTQEEGPHGVAVDSVGNVAMSGSFQQTVDFGGGLTTSTTTYSAFLCRYSSTGAWSWQRIIEPIYGGVGYGVAFDSHGNALLTGSAQGLADYGNGWYIGGGNANLFVAKYDSAGAYVWANVYGGSGNSASSVSALTAILATGTFGDGLNLGCGPMASAGGQNGFVGRFEP